MPALQSEKRRLPLRPIAARPPIPRPVDQMDPRWLLVERIARSRSLGRSALLVDFLRYVSDRQLRGRSSEITEQQIGVRIFGRPEGYNCNDDNIVRNYARTLRKRIDDYFREEGRDEPLTLTIPRGGYVPVFSPREHVPPPMSLPGAGTAVEEPVSLDAPQILAATSLSSAPPEAVMPEPPGRPPGVSTTRRLAYATAALLAFVVTAILAFLAGQSKVSLLDFLSADAQASRQLWSHLFERDRDTFIVPADGGLVMMQSFTRNKVTLADYLNGSYRSPGEVERGMQGLIRTPLPDDRAQLTHKVTVLAARRYTSIVDLDLAARLARLKEVVPDRLLVRFARDLRIDDLRTGNALLIGSNDANPWVSLFEPQLNFQFAQGSEFGGSSTIVNTHPLPGEQAHYASITGDAASRTYGVIAYVPNLAGTGHILLIEGVNMAGTEAAANFLLSPERMRPVIEHALDPNRKLLPFEVLLETSSVGANASTSKVLSQRVEKQGGY